MPFDVYCPHVFNIIFVRVLASLYHGVASLTFFTSTLGTMDPFKNWCVISVPSCRNWITQIYGHTRTHLQLCYGRSVTVGRKKTRVMQPHEGLFS